MTNQRHLSKNLTLAWLIFEKLTLSKRNQKSAIKNHKTALKLGYNELVNICYDCNNHKGLCSIQYGLKNSTNLVRYNREFVITEFDCSITYFYRHIVCKNVACDEDLKWFSFLQI